MPAQTGTSSTALWPGRRRWTLLYNDVDKYGTGSTYPLVATVHGLVADIARKRWAESGLPWEDFVHDASHSLVSAEDLESVQQAVLDTGYRFQWSAAVSVQERPEIYQGGDGGAQDFFEHDEAPSAQPDEHGWALTGIGDNVVRREEDAEGEVLFIRSSQQVLELLTSSVPKGTVAVIDDSGGTLTAPILEQFHAVICAGGTTRSHLGILTREYGIPCFMNAKVSGLRNGDRVRIQTTGQARTADDYQRNREVPSQIWRQATKEN